MYNVYKITVKILDYHTLSEEKMDKDVTRHIIASSPCDAIATCGAVLGQEIGEEGTFSSLQFVEWGIVDTEKVDLVAMHPQSLNPFVWDFEKGWCIYDKNSGTCVRKDNINNFVELGMHVVWLK